MYMILFIYYLSTNFTFCTLSNNFMYFYRSILDINLVNLMLYDAKIVLYFKLQGRGSE